jgi:hypothetical protein
MKEIDRIREELKMFDNRAVNAICFLLGALATAIFSLFFI